MRTLGKEFNIFHVSFLLRQTIFIRFIKFLCKERKQFSESNEKKESTL